MDQYLTYEGTFSGLRSRYFARLLKTCDARAGARVLDYGCGPGDFLLICRAHGLDATGVDNSTYSLNLARQRGLQVLDGDYTHPDLYKEPYDIILLQSVLEHVPDPVVLVSALRRALKPGGTLIVSAPTPGPYFWDDPTHIRPHTPQSLETLAQICGMDCVDVNYVFSYLLGLRLRNSFFYRVMNCVPFSLGSNLVAFYRQTRA